MDTGSYAVCAGLLARSQQLDLAAQDLANANTVGYRSQQTTFRSVLARAGQSTPDAWSAALNDFGVLGASQVTSTPGSLERTDNPLDFAIEGVGYFAVSTPAGVRFTRNGQFSVAATTRQLITRDGYAVLGDQGPMRVPEGTLSVSGDGTLSVDGALAGKLRLVQFPPGTPLQAEAGTYLAAPAGQETAAMNTGVRQGMLESANVNPITSAVALIGIQRTAQMLQRALTTFHSDFDRIAAQEISRVS